MVGGGRLRPRLERPLRDREGRVGHDQLGIDHPLEAQPVAGRAAAVRRVEGEDPRLELWHRRAAVEAGELLAEDEDLAALSRGRAAEDLGAGRAVAVGYPLALARAVEHLDLDDPLGELRGRLDRLRQSLADALLHHEAVDHDRDVVLELLVEDDGALVEAPQLAVDHGADVALRPHLLEHPAVLALAAADHGSQHHEPGALRQREHPVGDLLERLPLDRLSAVEAMRLADARPQEAQVVVDLGDRAHRRPRVARGGLLVDRDRR